MRPQTDLKPLEQSLKQPLEQPWGQPLEQALEPLEPLKPLKPLELSKPLGPLVSVSNSVSFGSSINAWIHSLIAFWRCRRRGDLLSMFERTRSTRCPALYRPP